MRDFERIASRDNARIAQAKKVRDGRVEAQMFVEGKRLVGELLRSDNKIETAFISDDFADEDLIERLTHRATSVFAVSGKLAASLEDTANGQGIFAIARKGTSGPSRIESALTAPEVPIVVLLNEVNNPSNLGAVIRTAEAAGVAGVITTERSASAFSPKALRAAMGSTFRMPIWEGVAFAQAITWAGSVSARICAAAGSGTIDLFETDWRIPRLLILGSEAHGLGDEQLALVQERVSIPMNKEVESLNLAVAAGVILFEARRQNSIKA